MSFENAETTSNSGDSEEAGSALSPTTTVELSDSTPPEKGGKEPKEPGAKAPLAERLQKAEGAVRRSKEMQQTLWNQLQKVREQESTREQELSSLRSRLEQVEALRARIQEGDEDALRELGGDFDAFLQRRLDPEATRLRQETRKVMSESDRRIMELEKRLQEREALEQQQRYQSEINAFLEVATGGDFPELQIVQPEDVVQLAEHVAPQLAKELGRVPKLRELAKHVNTLLENYHKRVYDSYSAREKQRMEQLAAEQAPAKKKVVEAAPAPKPKPPVSTLSNNVSTQKAAGERRLTAEERRQLAIRKFAQNTSDLPWIQGDLDDPRGPPYSLTLTRGIAARGAPPRR